MKNPVRILDIAGSVRRESNNRAALRAAPQLVPEGVTLDVFELDGIPGFKQTLATFGGTILARHIRREWFRRL